MSNNNNNKDTATRVIIGKNNKKGRERGCEEASSPSSSHKGHDMMKKGV